MSVKITVSYVDAEEKKQILALLKPLLDSGYYHKDRKGSPFNHLYIQHKRYAEREEENQRP